MCPSKGATMTAMPFKARDMLHRGKGKKAPTNVEDVGFPGYLTEKEFGALERLYEQVKSRSESFQSTAFCFENAFEDESYALCRWLRARKFVVADTLALMEEAHKCRSEASKHNFFPNPRSALGVEESVYISQYPQVYCGHARNGSPLFVSKPGSMNVEGIECITTLQGIINYHWYAMMHDLMNQLRNRALVDKAFKRYEVMCILDLENLTMSKVSKRALNIVKAQSEIDSMCFPETTHRMVVINAPAFFAMTWRVVRNWADPRAAARVQILGSNRSTWESALKELVDPSNLPKDYGGTGETFASRVQRNAMAQIASTDPGQTGESPSKLFLVGNPKPHMGSVLVREESRLVMSNRSEKPLQVKVHKGETLRLSVSTRSTLGGKLLVYSPRGDSVQIGVGAGGSTGVIVKHHGRGEDEEAMPTRIDVDVDTSMVAAAGTGDYSIRIEPKSRRAGNFVLIVKVFRMPTNSGSSALGDPVRPVGTGTTVESSSDEVSPTTSPTTTRELDSPSSAMQLVNVKLSSSTQTGGKDFEYEEQSFVMEEPAANSSVACCGAFESLPLLRMLFGRSRRSVKTG